MYGFRGHQPGNIGGMDKILGGLMIIIAGFLLLKVYGVIDEGLLVPQESAGVIGLFALLLFGLMFAFKETQHRY